MTDVTITWGNNKLVFNVDKLVMIDIEKPMLNIEKLPSGAFRMVITKSLIIGDKT